MSEKNAKADQNKIFKNKYDVEAKRLKKLFARACASVHHIGDTAVKKAEVSPIIDIMLVTKVQTRHDNILCDAGYVCMYASEEGRMAVYSRYDGEYTFRLHIISSELRYEISKRIAVVNYLNSMPEAAEEYYAAASADKREPDGTAYISGSAEDIEKLEAKALEWSESQAHLGTCMSIGMCLGMCLGMCFGSVFDNISVGMCFGMGIGLCFGSVFGSRKPSGSDKGQKK